MPPASRGAFVHASLRHSRAQARFRRNISIQRPRDPRNFPTQAHSRIRAKQDAPLDSLQQNPQQGSQSGQHGSQGGQHESTFWFRNLRKRLGTFTPQWLKDRPFVRTSIYSFFVTVPICGFLLMHLPLEPRRVTGPSMKPTINPECESEHDTGYSPTHVLVQTYNPNRAAEQRRNIEKEKWTGIYKRGDIIVYQTPHDPEKVAVKRVVGVPGDTVLPLKGYEGGEDPVTVQYYQLWVEGDVGDRKKSVDSNYFGPISEALVRGKVIAMWSPWWNIFGARRPNRENEDWPAKRQGRVAERAVYLAATNPDRLGYLELFKPARGEAFLQKLRQRPDYMRKLFKEDDQFRRVMKYYREHGLQEAESNEDPDIRERARIITNEMEQTFGSELSKPERRSIHSGQRIVEGNAPEEHDVTPAGRTLDAVVHEDEKAVLREGRERPAKAALREMVKQTKQLAEMKEKEIEERQQREL